MELPLEPVEIGVQRDGADVLTRGLGDLRLASEGTVVGGYAQLDANALRVGSEGDWHGTANIRRLVLFVAHDFGAWGVPAHAYTELEWEGALACDGCSGAAEVEQAFVEVQATDTLAVRTGLVLVPFGVINQWHEPPVFNGVERPDVDQLIIPTTWREMGVGLVGKPGIARWEAYVLTGLDPAGLGPTGLANARTEAVDAPILAPALAGRFEVEPWLGTVVGVSGYATDAGLATGYTVDGAALHSPVLGLGMDARGRWKGLEGRLVGAMFGIPGALDLMAAQKEDGSPLFVVGVDGIVPSRIQGGYAEVGYDVLSLTESGQQLVLFGRLETYDTQAKVPSGFVGDDARKVDVGTFGVTWRPLPPLAVKGDVQLRDRRTGFDELGVNAGVGWMF